jgi:deazaflavin-dependent oxidoreductase (nitroreductase family)
MTKRERAREEVEEGADPAAGFVVWLVTNPVMTWWVRNFAARLDPWLYRATNGRFHSMGPGSDTLITVTTTGRQSGRPRSVQLACVPYEGDLLLVASAMGQARHPAWRYNLEAHPECEVQARGERFRARATLLGDEEKAVVWDAMRAQIPMIHVYEGRTDRNIRVFRLRRLEC